MCLAEPRGLKLDTSRSKCYFHVCCMGHIFILFVVSLANAAADRYSLLQLPSFKRPGVADANASQWATWTALGSSCRPFGKETGLFEGVPLSCKRKTK